MQSSHFDLNACHGTFYGHAVGYEPGNFKIHHSDYVDHDASRDNVYGSSGIQAVHGYSCRDPPTYAESSTFYYSTDAASNFDHSNSYKIQNGATDCPNAITMARLQENFLIKPQESMLLANLQNVNGMSVSNKTISRSVGSDENLDYYHYHQHPHLHKHVNSFEDAPEHADKIGSNDISIFGHASIKMDSSQQDQSRNQFEEHMSSSTTVTSATTSRPGHQDLQPILHHSTNTSECTNPVHLLDSEVVTSIRQNSPDGFSAKEMVVEKKDEATGDSKPTMSYIALIAKAILESEQKRLNLGAIYNWIEGHYPFYKNKGQGWRNSVRHNLSLNDCFIKAGRCEDGKGNYWAIHPANIQDFMRGDFRQRRRSRRRGRKKDCDLSLCSVPDVYLQSPGASLTPGMTFNQSSLSSMYSPYTEAERRAYRLDEALLRQRVNNPFVKWYQQGVANSGYGVSSSPPACGTGMYPNRTPIQWPQGYTDNSNQAMYPALNSNFSR